MRTSRCRCGSISDLRRNRVVPLLVWMTMLLGSSGFRPIAVNNRPTSALAAASSAEEGLLIRLAAKPFSQDSSKPSSRDYTPRKVAWDRLQVNKGGVVGDYNHFRSIALRNTTDRAVSLWTTDMLDYCATYYSDVQPGDFGENILVQGVPFTFFLESAVYSILDHNRQEVVRLRITEPMEPCANLCKLPYINNDSKTPVERIEACHELIERLSLHDGMRGWYAAVEREGVIEEGYCIVRASV